MKQRIPSTRLPVRVTGRFGLLLPLSVVAVAQLLGACSERVPEKTVGQTVDQAIKSTQRAAKSAASDVKQGMASAGESVRSATQDMRAGSQETAQNMEAKIDDAAITTSIMASFAKDSELSAIKIDVETKSGAVTLIGPAPNSAAIERATTIARGVKGVTNVSNKLVLKAG